MKKIHLLIVALFCGSLLIKAQPSTAMDFTMNDCNGNMHHLFFELDSGNVVIMEFFMLNCASCIDAGNDLQAMYNNLQASYGNKVRFFHFGFSNNYKCADIVKWVTTNGFTSVPFDSGALQTAYYGGMGMPTMAVVGGSDHKVLFTNVGFVTSDTTAIGTTIRSFFTGTDIRNIDNSVDLVISPNPCKDKLFITLNSPVENIKIALNDIHGKEIFTQNISSSGSPINIDVSDLSNGIYFIKSLTPEYPINEKIIISK